jgi:hypothetical protein
MLCGLEERYQYLEEMHSLHLYSLKNNNDIFTTMRKI